MNAPKFSFLRREGSTIFCPYITRRNGWLGISRTGVLGVHALLPAFSTIPTTYLPTYVWSPTGKCYMHSVILNSGSKFFFYVLEISGRDYRVAQIRISTLVFLLLERYPSIYSSVICRALLYPIAVAESTILAIHVQYIYPLKFED